jgi:hypothetical protein
MTRLTAMIRSFSAQIWAWLKPGGPWLGLRRFVGALLVLAAFVTFGQTNSPLHSFADWVTGSEPGQITLSQPLVYTRERLVDDRLEQINWLNQRLRALDREPEPAFQSTEGRIERSRMVGAGVTPPPGASGGTGAAAPGGAPTAQPHQPLLETTMSRFQQMSLYREALRAERMRAILDDRHDIAGNTVFQLAFEATVLPSRNGRGAGIVALQIREDDGNQIREDDDGPAPWGRLKPALRHEYERLFLDWIIHLRQELAVSIEGRMAALGDLPQGAQPDGASAVLRALRAFVCSSDPRVYLGDNEGEISSDDAINDCKEWSYRGKMPTPGRHGFREFVIWLEQALERAKSDFTRQSAKKYEEILKTQLLDPGFMLATRILDESALRLSLPRPSLRIERQIEYASALERCRELPRSVPNFYVPFTEYERAVLARAISQTDNNEERQLLRGFYGPATENVSSKGHRQENQLPQFQPLSFGCPARYMPSIEGLVLLELYRTVRLRSVHINGFQFFEPKPMNGDTVGNSGQNIWIDPSSSMLCPATYARYHEARELQKLPPIHTGGPEPNVGAGVRLSDLLSIEVNEPFPGDCQLQIEAKKDSAQRLYERLRNPHRQTFTYGLTPRNETKRLESVMEALSQARLSVTTTPLGPKDIEAWYSTLERATGFLERISIAGFSNDKSFGWVFLPTQLGLEERHRLEMRTVQAILSLPAYWRRVHIKVARCWAHEGQYDAVRDLFHRDFFALNDWEKDVLPRRAGCQFSDLHIRIPGTEAEIQRALNLEILRTPFVKPNSQEEMIAYEGRPASFRLSGGRLWRSTTVTLGGQYADRIRILPDMRGIIAEFDCVNHPTNAVVNFQSPTFGASRSSPSPPFEETTAHLAVWTSEGTTERTTLPVKIRRAQGAEPYLSCRDINPATQRRPAPPTLRSVPPPSPFTGEVRN